MNVTNEFLKYRDAYIEKQFGRLNPVQKKAVFSTEGPLLILAGAGSGKTTVLVNRIANIIRFGKAHGSDWLPGPVGEGELTALKAAVETGVPLAPGLERLLRYENARPWNVLAITFTNKAAGDSKARLAAMLGEETGADVNASTFHSACVRMLRRDADRLGFPKSFTIYDTSDQERAMKEVYKELLVDDKFLPIKSAMGQIGRMKDQLISPDEAMEAPQDTKAGLLARLLESSARLKKAGAMDFDDLIYYTVLLLRENPNVLEYYQQKYRYVLVDEYQDTSVAQFHLVRLLAGGYKNVCVVGDDDQSIDRFRGATIENILNFEQHFPGAQVIRRAELPFHLQHSGRRQLRDQEQSGPQGQDPVDRERRRRPGASLSGGKRAGRGLPHCHRDRPASEGGRPPAGSRGALPHERPVRPGGTLLRPGRHSLQDRGWPAVLRPQGSEGHHFLYVHRGQTPTTTCA